MSRIKTLLKKMFINHFWDIYHKQYLYKLKINGIENKPCPREKDWIEKWSVLNIKPMVEMYRLFNQYIGSNINIVPETTCHYFIEPLLNPVKMIGYYQDKNFFEKILPKDTCPRAIIRKIQGLYYSSDYLFLKEPEVYLANILSQSDCQRIIVKPSVDTSSGEGVMLFVKESQGVYKSFRNSGILSLDYLETYYGANFIVQEAVIQSDFMSFFNKSSLNTLRLSVYRSVIDDRCHVTAAIMRIGGEGSFVDNAHAGGRFVGILDDGTLGKYTCDQFGIKQDTFNGIDFAHNEYRVPNYEIIKKFACHICEQIPHHRLLQLDISIDKDHNPILIEYNVDGYAPWLYQFVVGSAFSVYTDEIIDYCKDKYNQLAIYM